MNDDRDVFFMKMAIHLAERGRLTAPPNPWVGCLLVKNDEIVGQGFHTTPGRAHAEVVALQEAGGRARGATAYCSLEPCSHVGKTPPCVNALIEAGIKKVVIPIKDPDPQVAGSGIKALKKAGIEVITGVAHKESALSLAPYLHHRKTGLPYTVLKSAMTLDGKVAAKDGSSQWITGEMARKDVQLMRAQSQAVMVGSKTALVDQPRLTVRDYATSPLRVVLDRSGTLPEKGPLFDQKETPTLIFTENAHHAFQEVEVEVVQPFSLKKVLKILSERGVMQLLVEGGPTLHNAFIQEGLWQRWMVYLGAQLLGAGKPLIQPCGISSIQQAHLLHLQRVERFDDDVKLVYCAR